MVFDSISGAHRYSSLHPRIADALDFLFRFEIKTFVAGRTNIKGDSLFALLQEYNSKVRADGLWESHRRYADIQFIYEGEELLGCAPLASMRTTQEYVADEDYALYEGEGQFFRLRAKEFAIFFPEDVHMPGLAVTQPARVRKIVVKVEL
jgi:YhcH/YjgK/YiaL family protein